MSWDGAGNFNRLFSWVADKAAGLDISSSRMDSDTNNLTSVGFGNCLTRDGQGQPTANLPMAGFRHTGVQNAVARSDYAALGQVQDDLLNWTIAGGTADAITATYTPALTTLNDGQICFLRATAANATTTPTFAPNGLTAAAITKLGGAALGLGDIAGALAEIVLRYNAANTRWELLNPSNIANNNSLPITGHVAFTLASSAPTGWLMFNDGTFGSASSGANNQSAANLALFNMLFASPFTDSTAPLFTSTGAGTTRAAQGTAAAAWAANCRMSLPKTLGRALAVAGSGSGLTARVLGQIVGEENHTLTLAEIPTNIASSGSNTITVSSSPVAIPGTTGSIAPSASGSGGPSVPSETGGTAWASISSMSGTNAIGVVSNNTGGGAHNNIQPTSFMNAIVKT